LSADNSRRTAWRRAAEVSTDDADAIRAYVIAQANAARTAQVAPIQ
jgi:hypothetical protein